MAYSEKWGKDVETAVSLALADLKVPRDKVKVTVLEEASKGFFGIGAKLAKVRVDVMEEEEKDEEKVEGKKKDRKEDPLSHASVTAPPKGGAKGAKPEAKPTERGEKSGAKGAKPAAKKTEKGETSGVKKAEDKVQPSEAGVKLRERPKDLVPAAGETPGLDFLKKMVAQMGLNVDIAAYENSDCLYYEMSGKDCGAVIGKRGATLEAIQYLVSLAANRGREDEGENGEGRRKILVDAENYREKREKTLEQLAVRTADKVKRTGRYIRLEPMNPYERKVIHATLQDYPGITTRSEGQDPYRRVIVERK